MEAIAPQPSNNTKKSFKIAKKMCKHVQAKKGKFLTTPETKQIKQITKEIYKGLRLM